MEFSPNAIVKSNYGSINVYPDPSNVIFTIAGLGLNTAFRVYDIHGRLIKEVSKQIIIQQFI
ncbi:MAG: hypothetical protein J7604_09535 [Sporocytophaga sp.]|uniref:hypothetical protein n=1 Tax=Sporocytophaga sp. TaxID=2231183 RepID=UPI001B2350B8|nr:hypothetical protein [Sporocytophaga sp.]MBO9700437.1 hypothetical protein [Sporocytophaga sp.]